jgi:hypothetical protein
LVVVVLAQNLQVLEEVVAATLMIPLTMETARIAKGTVGVAATRVCRRNLAAYHLYLW